MGKYFYTVRKEKYGPYSMEELRNQPISRTTKVWCYGMDEWTELSQVPELSTVLNSIPPELNTKATLEEESNTVKPKNEPIYNSETKTQPSVKIKKSSSFSKWLIAIIAVILISLFAYRLIQNQSEVNQYNNEIAANSYDSDEDFDMYVQKFYRDLEFYGVYPKKPKVQIIKFSKLDQLDNTTHIHGLSFGSGDDDRIEIYINPSTWKQFNKPMRYFLMYHELAHDVLNLDDLEPKSWHEGKLMYPAISSYENKNMDDFIESVHALFEEQYQKANVSNHKYGKKSGRYKTVNKLKFPIPNGWIIKTDIHIPESSIDLFSIILEKENGNGIISIMSRSRHEYIRGLKDYSDYQNEKLVRNMKPTGLILTSDGYFDEEFIGVRAIYEYFDGFYKQTNETVRIVAINLYYKDYAYTIYYTHEEDVVNAIYNTELIE